MSIFLTAIGDLVGKSARQPGHGVLHWFQLLDFYHLSLITNKDNCSIDTVNCIKPDSKSGTTIYICKNEKEVYKIPPKNKKRKIIVNDKNKTIIVDNNTMNLLIQTIVKE